MQPKYKNLVLTKVDREFSRGNKNIYLGDWCFKTNELISIPNIDERIFGEKGYSLKAHNELKNNSSINKSYSKILRILSSKLNEIHNTKYSKKFWEILIGSWLRQSLETVNERYHSLRKIEKKYPNLNVKIASRENHIFPETSLHYSQLIETDLFNYQLYSRIIEGNKKFRKQFFKVKLSRIKSTSFIKNILLEVVGYLNLKFSTMFSKIILYKLYIGIIDLFKICTKFSSIPIIVMPSLNYFIKEKNSDLRQELDIDEAESYLNEFEVSFIKLLPFIIPKIYVEKYFYLEKVYNFLSLDKVRVFISGQGLISNDLYKFMVAKKKILSNVSNIALQHGSNYGQSLLYSEEQIFKILSDKFLTFGWCEPSKKIESFIASSRFSGVGNFRSIKPFFPKSIKKHYILCSFPRYYYTQSSAPLSNRYKNYVKDQLNFLSNINQQVKKNILVRQYPINYGWNEIEVMKNMNKNVEFYKSNKSLRKISLMSQITIFSYNSTSFYELLALNIPCIIFWNPNDWQWRKSAVKYLNIMYKVKIYHKTSFSAAKFINEFETNAQLLEWWSSSDVQEARIKICEKFAYSVSDDSKVWIKQIKEFL